VLVALLLPAVAAGPRAARRSQSKTTLKQNRLGPPPQRKNESSGRLLLRAYHTRPRPFPGQWIRSFFAADGGPLGLAHAIFLRISAGCLAPTIRLNLKLPLLGTRPHAALVKTKSPGNIIAPRRPIPGPNTVNRRDCESQHTGVFGPPANYVSQVPAWTKSLERACDIAPRTTRSACQGVHYPRQPQSSGFSEVT